MIKETDKQLLELYKEIEDQKSKPKVITIKKYSQIDVEAKEIKYQWFVRRLDESKRSEDLGEERQGPRGIDDMKSDLFGGGEIIIEDVKGRDGDLMDIEKEAVSRWNNMDKKIDEYAELIGENVLELKSRALGINNVLDRHEEKLDNLEEVVDLANTEMETSTKRLKKLLIKVRSGDKFCVTLCLLIILIGLVVVAYNIIKI